MQPLQLAAEDPFRRWACRFSRDSQSAEPTHLCLKVGVCLLMGGWGGEFYPNPFLLIRGLDSRRTLANGRRRPPGRGDILGAAPGPPILWPVRRAGWGLGPDPLGPPSGPSRITQTCSHPCCRCTLSFLLLLFHLRVLLGWSRDVLISQRLKSKAHPRRSGARPDWHPESWSRPSLCG